MISLQRLTELISNQGLPQGAVLGPPLFLNFDPVIIVVMAVVDVSGLLRLVKLVNHRNELLWIVRHAFNTILRVVNLKDLLLLNMNMNILVRPSLSKEVSALIM